MKAWLDPVTVNKIHILGSNYQYELLKQIPAENLPTAFGGTCQCPGGCELSDQGPWHDPEWARPAWWEKKASEEKTDAVVENAPGRVETSDGKAAEGVSVAAGETEAVKAPAVA